MILMETNNVNPMYTKTTWFLTYGCSTFGHILFFTIISFFSSLDQSQINLNSIIDIDLVSEQVYEKLQDKHQLEDNNPQQAEASKSHYVPKPNQFQVSQPKIKRSLKKKTIKKESVVKNRDKSHLKDTLQRLKQQVRISEAKHRIQSAGNAKSTVELMDIYKAEVMACIQRNWALSYQLIGNQPGLSATLVITIMRSGLIHSDIWFKKKSGHDYFDECVIKAVKKSNPLPPLPDGYLRSYYGPVGLNFTPSGLK